MSGALLPLLTALWLGVVTSISPCPLATNIAAISYLSRQVGNRRRALAGAAAYTLGRICVYLVLALVLAVGLASMPALSAFLRNEVLPLVGPVLNLAGMAVLGWLPFPVSLRLGGADTAERLSRRGLLGEFALGALFALSFCPVSAALFFGSLIPLVLASPFLPLTVSAYGVGTALPVALMAILLIVGADLAARALDRIQAVQVWAVRFTAVVLLLVGSWLTVVHTLRPLWERG